MNPLLSKSFSLIRFPLIVMVLLIHVYEGAIMVNGEMIGTGNAEVYNFLGRVFSKNLFGLAVPTFYFIAGYLFFLNEEFNKQVYLKQIKKRFKSLVIPYLFWNFWMILFMLFYQFVGNKVGVHFAGKQIIDYTIIDLFKCFWNIGSGIYPICFQLYFLRDLILVSILSPLFYWLIMKGKVVFMLLLTVMYVADVNWRFFPSISPIFFFCFGASYRLLNWNWIDGFKSAISRLSWLFLGLFPIIFFLENYNYCQFVKISGVIMLLNLVYYFVEHLPEGGKIERALLWLSPMSFFIYCFHEPVQGLIKKVLYMLIHPSSDALLVILYFVVPFLTISLAIIIFKTLYKYCPRLLKVINGR